MVLLEALCVLIVATYLLAVLRRVPDRRRYLLRFLLLVGASWIGEQSCIQLYGFYSYSPRWFPFVGEVPLLVVLIWPVVILSAGELAGFLLGPRAAPSRLAVAGGALVLADASLIEPLSVEAGLWSWTSPGFFAVPPVGVLGWALFATACLGLFAIADRRRGSFLVDSLVLVIAPALTHAGLLAGWWGALRWVSRPLPDGAVAAVTVALALLLSVLALRTRARRRVPLAALASRIPAALFFYGLLLMHGRDRPALVVHALAFAPPYLCLMDWSRLSARRRSSMTD